MEGSIDLDQLSKEERASAVVVTAGGALLSLVHVPSTTAQDVRFQRD